MSPKFENSQLKPTADLSRGAFVRNEEGLFKKEGEFGKNVDAMSILMHDSINQQCSNRGGGKGSVGNLLTWASGWRQNHPAEQWAPVCSLYLSLFLQLQLLPIQVDTEVGYSLDNMLCAYLQLRFERGPCWQLSPLSLVSSHIIHAPPHPQHLSFSPCSPTSHPFVYWFSRLRIPWVEDCNTQASNYFGGELICLSLASIWPVSVDNYAFPGPDSGANNEGQIESYV